MIPKDYKHCWEIDEVEFTVTVSPCSWMYDHGKIQLHIENDTVGTSYIKMDAHMHNATEAVILKALQAVKLQTCVKEGCNNKAFHPDFEPRDHHPEGRGMCEVCRVQMIRDEFFETVEEESKKDQERRKRLYNDGMRHIAIVWIHGKGDDYSLEFASSVPFTKFDIERIARREGSVILDDYSLSQLLPNGELL